MCSGGTPDANPVCISCCPLAKKRIEPFVETVGGRYSWITRKTKRHVRGPIPVARLPAMQAFHLPLSKTCFSEVFFCIVRHVLRGIRLREIFLFNVDRSRRKKKLREPIPNYRTNNIEEGGSGMTAPVQKNNRLG